MLRVLLEHIGEEVSCTKLPVSTYSQNKNELLSKIILPLQKLARLYFSQEISLVCTGSISDYYLRLEPDDKIRIGIIRKV